MKLFCRSLLVVVALFSLHCAGSSEDPAETVAAVDAAAVPGVESGEGAPVAGQLIPLARVVGYGNPATGELWMRTVDADAPDGSRGIERVGVQSHELGFCRQAETGADRVTLSTVPIPGCQDVNPADGAPDNTPVVCDRKRAFNAAFCENSLPNDPDAAIATWNEDPRNDTLLNHRAKFDAGGVACAGQTILNDTGRNLARVLLDYDTFSGDESQRPLPFPYQNAVRTPSVGRARPSELLGLYDFGPIPDGQSRTAWIYFGNNATTDFTFTGFIYGEVGETCNDGVDDDCDGVADNACQTESYGEPCYSGLDCRSLTCTGRSVVSLAGAAATEGNTLVDDVPGSCAERCNDGVIEGFEQCEDGNAAPGDGCDDRCTWEGGYTDTSWGPLQLDNANDDQRAEAVLLDGAGNTLIGGQNVVAGVGQWVILRADASGALDTSWANSGVSDQLAPGAGAVDGIQCMGFQSTGKIVAAGQIDGLSDIGVARWLGSGSIDTGFGVSSGYTRVNLSSTDIVADCVVLPDDRILVAATTMSTLGQLDMRLIMFSADGDIDASWAAGSSAASGVGEIVATTPNLIDEDSTFTLDDGQNLPVVFEFAKDGGLVTTPGAVRVDIQAATTLQDVTLAIGLAINTALPPLELTANMWSVSTLKVFSAVEGAASWSHTVVDPTFMVTSPTGGSVIYDSGANDQAFGMARGADGSITVAGRTGPTTSPDPLDVARVVRVSALGVPDAIFGSPTILAVDRAFAVAVDGADTYVVGDLNPSTGFIAKLNGSGALVATFGDAGIQSGGGSRLFSVLMGPSRTVVAGGQRAGDLLMVRVESITGGQDTSFGAAGNGQWQLDVAGLEDSLRAIAYDPLQDVVVGVGFATDSVQGQDAYAIRVRQ